MRGFYGEEFIGVLYYNPVMKMFIPESVELLKKKGYEDFDIEVF